MADLIGHLFRQAVIFGCFCWMGGRFCPPGHHFCSFLSALRSIFPARPSFSALFADSTVVMAGSDRPSPAGRDAVPSLSRRKRGRPGRWTSQLLLLRPRPSAWPVTSSNKLRPAASGVTAPSPGPRALPFPPIRSGISAPPLRHGRPDRPSLPPGRHFWLFLLEGRSFLSAGPSFLLIFVGLAVNFSRQAIIFCPFCWLDGCHGRP